jgi:hypothetical protein
MRSGFTLNLLLGDFSKREWVLPLTTRRKRTNRDSRDRGRRRSWCGGWTCNIHRTRQGPLNDGFTLNGLQSSIEVDADRSGGSSRGTELRRGLDDENIASVQKVTFRLAKIDKGPLSQGSTTSICH